MKPILLTIVISIQFLLCAGQNSVTKEKAVIALQKPEFPGGKIAMYKYLAENIRFPERAIATGSEGTVRVNFVILKDGSVSNVEVKRSLGYRLDEEAIRVVKSMPKWKAGRYKGKPINYFYQVPVKFVIQ